MTRLLQHWVTEQAQRRPGSLAVVCGTARLTYGELDTLSNQLARLLRDGGCRGGDRVALLVPKSPMAVAGLLGILKADAIYVPLDPSSPVSRLKKVLESCESEWILAVGPVTPVLQELLREDHLRRLRIGLLDGGPAPASSLGVEFTSQDISRASAAPVPSSNVSDDPSHILFTSGSTGTPKGVVITHANVIHYIEWAIEYFGIDSSDRVSQHAPLHFDLSFFDIFGTAAAGGELHVVPPELNVLPNKLADFIRASELTQWFSVPSILNYLAKFDVVTPGDFPHLKRLLWAGEVLPTPTLMYWMQRLPHVRFTNLYGPTETTIVSSYHTVPACPEDPQAAIPIGIPCAGEELLVLDESLQRLPHGQTGDLYIAGVGLARGYWRDPERTAAAFVPHPERPSERIYRTGDLARIGDDGLTYFLGRKDSQIKSRGYRIELGEIEAALNTIGSLQESAVVAINTEGFEGAVICCAYVPAESRHVDPAALRQELRRLVPSYMLPARWRAFDQFPKNANGKTDRRWLKGAFEEASETRAAQIA
jgi:amino acid adenylation domain-containing protein